MYLLSLMRRYLYCGHYYYFFLYPHKPFAVVAHVGLLVVMVLFFFLGMGFSTAVRARAISLHLVLCSF
jgi:hypothetical protein